MSDETQINKKEKKEKREKGEKKQKKVKVDAEASTAVEEPNAEVAEVKKEKKDKKRKHEAEEVAEVSAGKVESEEKPKKKKKSKAVAEDTPATTDVEMTSTPEFTPAASTELSKKQLKKLAKAAKAATVPETPSTSAGATPVASSSSTSPSFAAASASEADTAAYLAKNEITLTPALFPAFLSLATLPINPALRPYLSAFKDPTPIQACSWPPLFAGRDVIGIAETGSGKTLSFGLPGLHRLSTEAAVKKGKGQIGILVVAPTRELAMQTHVHLKALGELVGIGAVCLFGGMHRSEQIAELRQGNVRIVVGTPGRIMDLAESRDVDFSGVKYLVLDEADRMLDQGFENDIRKIIAYCPTSAAGRQTVMFSATWPDSVRRLAATYLSEPVKITVGSDELSANKRIDQKVEVFDDSRAKDPRLLYHLRTFLAAHPKNSPFPARILVFALYKKEATRLEGTIRRAGYTVSGLHGDMDQNARFRALDAFKQGDVNVLVATDVAARGLDIPDVGLVINVTFPLTTEDFVHRCGRTGRAGKSGKAVTFFTGENHERSLAGEFMRVLRDAGAEIPKEMDKFPSTIKKKEHGSYGAFYKDTTGAPAPKKIVFD